MLSDAQTPLPGADGEVAEDGVEEHVHVVVADEVPVEHQHRQIEQHVVHCVVYRRLQKKCLPR